MGRYHFYKMELFKYLGTILTENNETLIKKVESRIPTENKCSFESMKLLRSQSLLRNPKKQFNTILIRPIVTYGADCKELANSKKSMKTNSSSLIRNFREQF